MYYICILYMYIIYVYYICILYYYIYNIHIYIYVLYMYIIYVYYIFPYSNMSNFTGSLDFPASIASHV